MNERITAHKPCPDCGSHDALDIYDDHTYCHSCETYTPLKDNKVEQSSNRLHIVGTVRALPERAITEDTCKKFNVHTLANKEGIIKKHLYPYYDKDNNLVAVKTRVVDGKLFSWEGEPHRTVLFGANIWAKGGKYVTVCEGECDALAVSQMFGNQYATVSVPNGAGSLKAIKDSYDYLDTFENIILCWDGDEVGQKNVRKIAAILPPKKTKIVKMPEDLKDPNEFLKAGKSEEFRKLWWRAEEYRPEDITNIGDMYSRLDNYKKSHKYISTPWSGLNDKIVGTRFGQLVVCASGTGMGKALRMDANILTPEGWKINSDIFVGDEVISVDGTATKVLGVYPQGVRAMYKITFSDGRSIECDGEHLWEFSGEVMTTLQAIEKLEENNLTLPTFKGWKGLDTNFDVDPYTIGALIGDGSLKGGIRFYTKDEEILEELAKHCKIEKSTEKFGYRLKDAKLRDFIKRKGLEVVGSDKFIPDCFKYGTVDTRFKVLQGLFDTDGTVYKDGSVEYVTTSERLAKDISEVLRSLGYICKVSRSASYFKGERKKDRFRVFPRGEHCDELFRLTRKKERIRLDKPYRPVKVVSIVPCGKAEAQCIRVAHPSALFVTDDYIVTHNSSILRDWLLHFLHTTDYQVGGLFFEEAPEETVISLMSIVAGKNLKKPVVWEEQKAEDIRKWYDAVAGSRKVELYESLSSDDAEYICAKIRYLAVARDCKIIFFDHITYITDDSDNPRLDINKLVKRLHALCVELGITIISACHLRKASGNKTHEEGGRVTLDDLKESSSIKQLSDIIIGFERDGQAKDPIVANTTLLRVLKNRDFGEKGEATALLYDRETTRMQEVPVEFLQDEDDDIFGGDEDDKSCVRH